MSIPDLVKTRFDLLLEWAETGGLVLMQCSDEAGQPAYVICLHSPEPDGDHTLVPVARMLSDTDIDKLTPPE